MRVAEACSATKPMEALVKETMPSLALLSSAAALRLGRYSPALPAIAMELHAAQIVASLIPVRQVPKKCAAGDQLGALRAHWNNSRVVAGDERTEIRRGNQD